MERFRGSLRWWNICHRDHAADCGHWKVTCFPSACVISTGPDGRTIHSSRGSIAIWDALTLQPMRSISSPSPRPLHGMPWDQVDHLVVDQAKDILIAGIGSQILFWHAGKSKGPGKAQKGKVGGHSASRPPDARYIRGCLLHVLLGPTTDMTRNW